MRVSVFVCICLFLGLSYTVCAFLLPLQCLCGHTIVCVESERILRCLCLSACLSISFPVCLSLFTCLHLFMCVFICLRALLVRGQAKTSDPLLGCSSIIREYLPWKEMWHALWGKSYEEPKCDHHGSASCNCNSVEFLIDEENKVKYVPGVLSIP